MQQQNAWEMRYLMSSMTRYLHNERCFASAATVPVASNEERDGYASLI